MLLDVIMLLVSLACILAACLAFTNGIELLGHRLQMHQAATGSILAAVGTALPETIIPIIALATHPGDQQARDIAVGAIMGAPFMLATLAMLVTGAAVLIFSAMGRRKRHLTLDPVAFERDMTWFFALYGVAILASFAPNWWPLRLTVAIGLVIGYIFYTRQTLGAEGHANEITEKLYLSRLLPVRETRRWITLQVAAALLLMMFGAHLFVDYVADLSHSLGVLPLVLSLIVTPIATELPEKLNSVVWIGQRKDTLAVGNISGAMVFQSAFPVSVGVLFTSWNLRGPAIVSAALALSAAGLVLIWSKRRRSLNPYVLLACGLFYAIFIVYIWQHGAVV